MSYSLKLSLRITTILSTLALAGLVLIVFTRSPSELGPFGITLWFVLMITSFGGSLTLVIYQFKKIFARVGKFERFNSSLRQGTLFSVWFSALLALSSLRQLGLKDMVLVTSLVLLINFYLRRLQ